MGLTTGLLTLPLAPVRGLAWVSEQLLAAAREQMYGEPQIYAELRGLVASLEAGEISEADFDVAEDELLARLSVARASHDPSGGVAALPARGALDE